jgi:hypothetical protein
MDELGTKAKSHSSLQTPLRVIRPVAGLTSSSFIPHTHLFAYLDRKRTPLRLGTNLSTCMHKT